MSASEDPSFARLTQTSDEDLMRLVRDGKLRAFECLVERYKVGVFSLCLQILRSREDAEEASQDTFVKAFRARAVYDPARKVAPWLLKIASNAARDVLRKRVSRTSQHSDYYQAEVEQIADRGQGEEWERGLEAEEVRRVLGSLGDEYRIPLTLKYLNGLTNPEIAESIGVSLSSLKVRLARARELLQNRLLRRLDA